MLANAPLFYPSARDWMWNYCMYLGPYTDETGSYDLGVYIYPSGQLSFAIVYDDEDGRYISGALTGCIADTFKDSPRWNVYRETIKRAQACGLIQKELKNGSYQIS